MQLTPSEFWDMGLVDFLDIANAIHEEDEHYWDRVYQVTAWQSALLMNATGNYGKKQIKPEMLYKSPFDQEDTPVKKEKNRQYVAAEQEKLKELFGLE